MGFKQSLAENESARPSLLYKSIQSEKFSPLLPLTLSIVFLALFRSPIASSAEAFFDIRSFSGGCGVGWPIIHNAFFTLSRLHAFTQPRKPTPTPPPQIFPAV